MNTTLQKQTTGSRVAVYYELTKPKIWYLLVFTAFGAALTASNIYNIPISIETWALMLFSVASGSAAANTLTNYHDRDIDAIMERTKDRPLPSKRIYPAVKARNFGLALAGYIIGIGFCNFIYYNIRARNMGNNFHCICISKQHYCLFICAKTKF